MTLVRHTLGVRRRAPILICALVIALAMAVPAFPNVPAARADGAMYPSGMTGFDYSWPQCKKAYPNLSGGFGIVGVNDGRAFTYNDCFADQYQWAMDHGAVTPSVYLNINGLDPAYTHWSCTAGDVQCLSYRYGRATAVRSIARVRAAGFEPATWWLDVETMNRWAPDTASNATVIAGALDVLKEHGVTYGVYSTWYQWGVIAGDYAPGVPTWAAGARDYTSAVEKCRSGRSWGGGEMVMVQWVQKQNGHWFDHNVTC